MPNWTKEQQEAIDKENTNIIVSAGAGSGKTAVLTERVIRKLKQGVNVNELLILTFTKAAAYEMKERIRTSIEETPSLIKQLDYIDSSYITTFDSYALSVVKKYHVLLNISPSVKITDASIIYLEKKRKIDLIFDSYYEKEDKKFLSLIEKFCTKDDKDIKNACISISDKLDLKFDKEEYLNSYIEKYFSDSWIDSKIDEYVKLIFDKKEKIDYLVTEFSREVESDYFSKFMDSMSSFLESNNYEQIVSIFPIKIPILRTDNEEAKKIKTQISSLLQEIEKLLFFSSREEMKKYILLTKEHTEVLIDIIKKLDYELVSFKKKYDLYEFTDISKMAIDLLKKFPSVCKEISDSFQEIMVDEYQDTSDLQEVFINLIEKNNVYMVGDIKQSIYRFRNANPYLFKEKYDNYSKNFGGYKIDLNKNFRSREEVLNNINLLFNFIMDDDIGQADYKATHQMIFGNKMYIEEGKTDDNRDFEVYTYQYEKGSKYTKDEIEIFTIAKDIKDKIENHYQVLDKKTKKLRDITYKDFVVLIDRSSLFDLYKKIFEYLKIPISKYKNTKITGEIELLLLRNILLLLLKVSKKEFDTDFRYAFTSVARSFLFQYSDQEIFDVLNSGNFYDTSVLEKVLKIPSIEEESIDLIFDSILDTFQFYEKISLIGDVLDHFLRFDYLKDMVSSLSNLGYTVEEFYLYLNQLIEDDYKLEVVSLDKEEDSVKLMTIHTSKGLEFPVCYFPALDKTFNIRELNEKFLYDNKYGIICPYFDDGIGETIYKELVRNNYIKEEISEKIRLFYVAVTRCKEKMILILNSDKVIDEYPSSVVDFSERMRYRSFADFLKSISGLLHPYQKEVNIENLSLTKDYNLIQSYNYQDNIEECNLEIEKREVLVSSEVITSKHFSKTQDSILDKETQEKMEFGSRIHELFEYVDFLNPVYPSDVSSFEISLVDKFLNSGLDFKNATIHKEYSFIIKEEKEEKRGIIDLILEYDSCIKIIDYKLKKIEDSDYLKQLEGYRDYISKKTGKMTFIYLYSILDGVLEKIDD